MEWRHEMGPPQCLVIEVRQSIDKRGDERWPEVTENGRSW